MSFAFPACFAEEELPLDSDGAEVLSETFNVLSLKEFKLQAVSAPAGGAEESEEENVATMTKVVLQVAQRKVVSQVQKKAFIENTVPLIISLKNLLEQKRSPVLKDLMAYLQVRAPCSSNTPVSAFTPSFTSMFSSR